MEPKTQKKEKNRLEVEELLKFPQQVERELEYWIKEKKVSYMEKAIKANDMNTRFAGTYSLEMCFHPDDDIMDIMIEEEKELIEKFEESVDFEDKEDGLAEAG